MNLKRMIWRTSHVEEILGILWLIAAILAYSNEEIRFATVIFIILSIAAFIAAIIRSREESRFEKERKKYTIIKEDGDMLMMRIVENSEEHPETLEHNGHSYKLEYCCGKDAVFKRERK